MARLLKLISAFALMASFFMPLSQCTQKGPAEGPHVQSAATSYEWPSTGSLVLLLMFGWPLAGQVLSLRQRQPTWQRRYLTVMAEVLLSAATLATILFLLLWANEVRYGAYIAIAAVLSYLLLAVWLGYQGLKRQVSLPAAAT
ncbi:hypothetical protein QWZ03_01080 [Chitinimonas viridis]|uniref:DUF3325 domain-containing protein n=1 Tax=Chitinimonas viridis TaxID=664880 RepID=A0ABT8B0L0_9NEIS|nr:hypothetical protein [Chitinimonas viridis]MDN3575365.1 hypothetical protein [Chitinimonas viridis]